MSSNFTVIFGFGNEYINVSSVVRVKEFFKERFIYNRLKPTADTCRFKMKYDQTIISKLLLFTGDIKAQVYKDNVPYFKGIVVPSYRMKSAARVEWVDIELSDNSYLLNNQITSDIQLPFTYLANSNTLTNWSEQGTEQSLVHHILYKAGYTNDVIPFSLHAYSSGTTHVSMEYFTHLKQQPPSGNDALSKLSYGGSWKELLTNVLFQYGFTYYFNDYGQIQLFSFVNTNIEATINMDNTNIYDNLIVQKNEPNYDSAEIHWYGQELVENKVIFNDDTGSNAQYLHCNIILSPNSYYPPNANAENRSQGYYNIILDGRKAEDIVAVKNPRFESDYYGYDLFVQSSYQTPNPATRQEPIYGWIKANSEEIWHWWPWAPSWVNGTTIRATYLKYKCRGFLCTKDGHLFRIDYYYWGITGYKTVPAGGTITVDNSYTEYKQPNVIQEFISKPLSFEIRIKNDSLLYPVYIRKLRVIGDIQVRSHLNISRSQDSIVNKTFSYTATYLYSQPMADRLAESLHKYYKESSYTYVTKSFLDIPVGSWVLLTDNNFQNVDNFPVQNKRCLVVSRKDNEFTGEIIYSLEQYSDYEVV